MNRPGVDMTCGGRWVKGGERVRETPRMLLRVVRGEGGSPPLGKCLGMKWDGQVQEPL